MDISLNYQSLAWPVPSINGFKYTGRPLSSNSIPVRINSEIRRFDFVIHLCARDQFFSLSLSLSRTNARIYISSKCTERI